MPGIDGFALCQKIKADDRYRHLPVLLISGIVNAKVKKQAEQVGATDIVKKPFTPEDLFPKIELALASAPAGSLPEADMDAEAAPEAAPVPTPAQPQGSVREVLEALMQPLLSNSAVDAALVADAAGACLAESGRGFDDCDTLTVYSRTLASVAATLGDNLGVGALGSLHIDYQGHSLLITRLATRGTLLLRIKDASSVGVARYLVKKFVEEEEKAFQGQPVLAS